MCNPNYEITIELLSETKVKQVAEHTRGIISSIQDCILYTLSLL